MIQSSIRWDNFDFTRFRELASELSPHAATNAGTAESKMHWLVDQLNSARREAGTRIGYDWSLFPWERYYNTMIDARNALTEISDEAGQR